MSSLAVEPTPSILAGLFAATAPSDPESPEARAARENGLKETLQAFRPRDMQEALLGCQVLAAHHTAMARLRESHQENPGTTKSSRLLRDTVAAQRMLLTAARGLRLWREASIRAELRLLRLPARPVQPHAQRTEPPAAPAAAPARPATADVTPPAISAPPPPAPAKPAAPPAQPKPAPLAQPARHAGQAALEALRRSLEPNLPAFAAARSDGALGFKAALRATVAMPAAA